MELTNNINEIIVPFGREILNFESETEIFNDRIDEEVDLKQDILKRFLIVK